MEGFVPGAFYNELKELDLIINRSFLYVWTKFVDHSLFESIVNWLTTFTPVKYHGVLLGYNVRVDNNTLSLYILAAIYTIKKRKYKKMTYKTIN